MKRKLLKMNENKYVYVSKNVLKLCLFHLIFFEHYKTVHAFPNCIYSVDGCDLLQ